MNNEFKELQRKWENGKKIITNKSHDIDKIILKIAAKKRGSLYSHYGNIIIMMISLIGISLFFYYVAPVKEILSIIGASLMIGGLGLRIVIEIFSTLKSKKIDVMDNALAATNNSIAFYEFRKTIHGPITFIIFGLYSIGFYMITPEFSLYFSLWKMILIDVSYIVIAVILVIIIRNGIKKEMKTLLDIIQLRKEIID